MRLINVVQKDIWVTLEFPLQELRFLKKLLDNAEIKYDGKADPEMQLAESFLQETFYPFLKQLIDNAEKEME